MKDFDLSLYLVLDDGLGGGPLEGGRALAEIACAAVAGGATMVQLRHKGATTGERIAEGRRLRAALGGAVPLIVNDDLEACLEIGADGLHVGQGDLAPDLARARLGPGRILGLSVETEADARAVDRGIVDYVGAGPVFATATKPGHAAPVGLDGLARIVAAAPVPAVAIGGLGPGHVDSVLAAGAVGLAVVSAICAAPDPKAAAADFAGRIAAARKRGE